MLNLLIRPNLHNFNVFVYWGLGRHMRKALLVVVYLHSLDPLQLKATRTYRFPRTLGTDEHCRHYIPKSWSCQDGFFYWPRWQEGRCDKLPVERHHIKPIPDQLRPSQDFSDLLRHSKTFCVLYNIYVLLHRLEDSCP